MINKGTVTIRDKEYNFLKPNAFRLVAIEDDAYATGSYDAMKYNQAILNIVDKKLKVRDFISENKEPITLENGDVLSVNENFTIENFTEIIKGFETLGRLESAKAFAKVCGLEESYIEELSYNDINKVAEAFMSIFDLTELDEVVGGIVEYCFPR